MEKILDEPTKRVLAVRASVDPRTIDKVFRGEPVKGMAGYRAAATLRAAGLLPAARSSLTTARRSLGLVP
jgi:hypothetical protein